MEEQPSAVAVTAPDGEHNVIFRLACECDDYFEQYFEDELNLTKHGVAARNLVEDYHRRFKSWAEYLGAFAKRKSSLDLRLRNRQDVREMVVQLLIVLRRNVAYRQ
jgi:hypothetical protein